MSREEAFFTVFGEICSRFGWWSRVWVFYFKFLLISFFMFFYRVYFMVIYS